MWNSCFASNNLIVDAYLARQEQSGHKEVVKYCKVDVKI